MPRAVPLLGNLPYACDHDGMSKHYALVIDDERDIRELLTLTLGRMDLIV